MYPKSEAPGIQIVFNGHKANDYREKLTAWMHKEIINGIKNTPEDGIDSGIERARMLLPLYVRLESDNRQLGAVLSHIAEMSVKHGLDLNQLF